MLGHEAAPFECCANDYALHCIEYHAHTWRVCGAGDVVKDLVMTSVAREEFAAEILYPGFSIFGGARIVAKLRHILDIDSAHFITKEVHFIEE